MIETKDQLKDYQKVIDSVKREIEKVMIGQKEVIEQLLLAVFAGGHALLEGVPGLGKTLLVRTLAQALDLSFNRIQFTPDLMPSDIIGTNILQVDGEKKRFEFQKGPVFANVILADEINRTTPKTQSAMLEAMQEHTISVGGTSYKLPEPFFVLATQNPLEQEGTYPLPEAQMDRFILKINVPFPTEEELIEIVEKAAFINSSKIEKIADGKIITDIQATMKDILVAEPVMNYAARLLLATHPNSKYSIDMVNKYIRVGAGPRGLISLIHVAKVRAFFKGRYNVSFEDIDYVALPGLRHRLLLNFEGEANGIKTDDIILEIIKSMENQK